MKVFDLYCSANHVFEGWFASEQDFLSQQAQAQIECPMCGITDIRKGVSAPRLNLLPHYHSGSSRKNPTEGTECKQIPRFEEGAGLPSDVFPATEDLRALQAAWLDFSRRVVQQTEDVGHKFADEARCMYAGEAPPRPIRGQVTTRQAVELLEEGVPILPLALAKSSTDTLQ